MHGSQLSSVNLDFCCNGTGVGPRCAATVLLSTATPCAVLFVGYALYSYADGAGANAGLMVKFCRPWVAFERSFYLLGWSGKLIKILHPT